MNALGTRFGCSVLLALGSLSACNPESEARDDGIPLPQLEDVDPDVVEAIHAARAAVQHEPLSSEAWGRLGNRYYVHDFTEEAARCFAKAEELDPKKYVWSYRLGWSLIDDHPDQAAAAFERCLHSLDDYAPAHEVYAHALLLLGREDEAIEHFTRASALDPAAPQAETGLGLIHLARGEYELARTHLEQALARDEQHGEAHTGIAQVYLALGMEKEARRHAELSRTLPQSSPRADWLGSPDVPPAGARMRTKAGKQLEKQGKPEEAAEQYRIAVRSNPDYYQARLALAELLVEQGKGDEARALLHEAEQRNPDFAQVRQDVARLFGR
jgi:tetratricopeptide (TPR) repeat protein